MACILEKDDPDCVCGGEGDHDICAPCFDTMREERTHLLGILERFTINCRSSSTLELAEAAVYGFKKSHPKHCVKCECIIPDPYLLLDEPERCARCGDS